VPEFAALLGVPPDAGDPLTAQPRAQRTALRVLRVVASRHRPLVVFVDDLQWAGRTPLGAVDLMLTEEPVEGLLLVGAYRDGDVEAGHPLAAPLSRWRQQAGVQHLRLVNLPRQSVVTIVAEMLHVDRPTAASLVDLIEPHAHGNPYEVVELLNALRRGGELTPTAAGWRWDVAAVRAQLGESEVAELPAARLDVMPPASRQVLEAMACLGGRAELSQLQIATEQAASAVEQALAPALHDGVLTLETGAHPAVRFRHDRAREAILRELRPERRRSLQLEAARRLAAVPELFAVAAEQYLPVCSAVTAPGERRAVVGLVQRAADQAALTGDYELVNALMAAALRLVDPADARMAVEVRTRRHTALFSLGRLEEADEEYRNIEELCPTALDRADATAVQVHSLTHRTRFAEALELGLQSLRECGIDVPAAGGFSTGLAEKFDGFHRWLDTTGPADDLTRPELSDPGLLATGRLIDAVLPVAYFVADPPMIAWLAMEAVRIWREHGPSRILVGSAGHAAYQAGPQGGDYHAAYRSLQRIIALGEAHGYEPGTSQARYMAATIAGWFEPIEDGVEAAHRAREGLLAGGELAYVGYTYLLAVPYSVDCAPSLASFVAEIDDGLAFLRRTGNEQTGRWLDSYQWLVGVLRSESFAATTEAVPLDRYADDPTALIYAHLCRAIAAAIFGDSVGLAHHSAAAVELLQAVHGFYAVAQVRLLRGLALAEEARAADADVRDDLLAELDELTRWLAEWAADTPDNFLHQLRLIEAERAWAVGDFRAAVLAFDAARRDVADRRRPWHRALIAERAARFYLANAVEHAGYDLLAQARRDYLEWGATAKVDQLDWAYPPLRRQADAITGDGSGEAADLPQHPSTVTTGTIDLLGILSASQALSSETSIERLHARVVEVLGSMTGATGVHLLLWSDERHDWLLPPPDSGGIIPVGGSDHEHAAPMSVLRYVQRTREPLLVTDASADDRFIRDPYFADSGRCSLLAVPIFRRGTLRAVLVLENRLIRGAFSTERLDAVKLIADQLAVSLDNAQLYAELASSRARIVAAGDETRRRIGRDLHDGAQQRLAHTIVTLKVALQALDEGGQVAEFVGEALENAQRGLNETRELAHGLHPRVLSSGGLAPALDALASRSAIPASLDLRSDVRLPERVEVTAYYVVSEALANVAKHSKASAVEITVDTVDGELRLTVSDDGVGGADLARGSGLVGLQDRVEAIGGTFTVESPPGQGTRLDVRVAVNADIPAGSS
jgi:signal transduction histidine kinase